MPPRGVKKGSKRERQYEHVKESQLERGAGTGRAEEIAARTVNKERAAAADCAPETARRRGDGRGTSFITRRARWGSKAARG
jgi:hypothetical protein